MHQLLLFLIPFFLVGCRQKTEQPNSLTPELMEALIKANQKLIENESGQIDNYLQLKKLKMSETGTGLRYVIIEEGGGKKASPGMIATVRFKLSLLDGTLCYQSDSATGDKFMIDKDQVESGLHEGIKLMNQGGKAKFILPSHLAHGLAGDQNCIKARSPVIYDIELLNLE